jgi:tetratricopeptide (TPR) repeat protein
VPGRVALALLALGVLACSPLPSVRRERLVGWHAVGGDGFRLIGDAPSETLRHLADELAIFQRVFEQLARMPPEGAAPVWIVVLEDPDLQRRFGLAGSVAGWTLTTLDGCYAAVELSASHVATRITLFHEYTHTLLHRNRRAALPPWYDEGLSSYFSTLSLREGAVVVGMAPTGMREELASHGPMAVEQLLSAGVWSLPPREISDFYATAWALVHQLLGSPRGRDELARFVAELERGVGWRDAFGPSFGRSPDDLARELAAHVAILSRPVATEAVIPHGALGGSAPGAPVALSAAEVAYELGILALELDSLEPGEADANASARLARALLETAHRDAPANERVEAAFAEARARTGEVAEPLVWAQRATGAPPDDPRVALHAGAVALLAVESALAAGADAAPALATARVAYERARTLDPSSPLAWIGLGRTEHRTGRPDAALQALERARGLGWSASLDLELGTLYLERERRAEALALLWPIAQDPHGGPTSEKARKRLDAAGLLPDETLGAAAR